MKLSTRLLILTLASLFGLLLLGGMSLYFKKQGLLHEKETQITHLLQVAENIVERHAKLAAEGKLPEALKKSRAYPQWSSLNPHPKLSQAERQAQIEARSRLRRADGLSAAQTIVYNKNAAGQGNLPWTFTFSDGC